MKYVFLLCTCMLFSLFSCQDPIETESAKALEAYQSGDYQKAIDLNQKVLDLDSNSTASIVTYYNLSVIYREQQQWQKAAEPLLKIINIDSSEVNAYADLGLVYLELEQLDLSIEYSTRALGFGAENPYSNANLAVAYRLKGIATKRL